MTVDGAGNIILAGSTDGNIKETNGDGYEDLFVVKLNASGLIE